MFEGESLRLSMVVLTSFLNWPLAFLFLYLRVKGDKGPMTQSQKTALTFLCWIFFLNSITITLVVFFLYFREIGATLTESFLSRVSQDIDLLIGILLLGFGLVYPRPFTRWRTLWPTLLLLLGLTMIFVFIQVMDDRIIGSRIDVSTYTYIFGWFVPVMIWLPLYEKETSPHSRMVLTLFIWGFITVGMINGLQYVVAAFQMATPFHIYHMLLITFCLYTFARLVLSLWRTRREWDKSSKVNILFLIFVVAALMADMNRTNPFSELLVYFADVGAWTIIRPALFSYAILRYQIFGPHVKVERHLSLILGICGAITVAVLVQLLPIDVEPGILIGAGAVLALILFLPIYRYSKSLVTRFLPMTSGREKATMREKRATYLISLQTAVVKGKIDLEEDKRALKRQRKALRISDREHTLLIDSFAMREAPVAAIEEVDELFLVNIDGRLLVHVGQERRGGAPEKDKDIVAGMLVAIRDYVQEGLQTGKRTALESIKYGKYSLVIETEGSLVLAAVLKGPGGPEMRQHLRDQLTLLNKRHGKALKDWDGDLGKAQGAKYILEGFIEELEIL